jgi:hypothetical protein
MDAPAVRPITWARGPEWASRPRCGATPWTARRTGAVADTVLQRRSSIRAHRVERLVVAYSSANTDPLFGLCQNARVLERLTRSAFRLGGALFCFGATLELMARCDDVLTWGAPFWGEYSQDRLSIVDELGPRCRPGGHFEKWKLDSHGFRGPEVADAARPGMIRILVVGASESFGLYESPGKEYPAELQRQLEAARPGRFEVINAACAGMTPPRIDSLLRSFLGRFRPDWVLFYPSPQFYLDEEPPRAWRPGAPQPRPRCTSRVARRLSTALKSVLPARIQTRLRDREIQSVVQRHEAGWVWTTPPRERVELFRTHLQELVAAVRSLGARPILLTHANRFGSKLTDEDRQELVTLRKFFPRASLSVLLPFERSMNRALLDTAVRANVTAIDTEQRVGKAPAYFADFSHFTDRGAQAMAAVLSRELVGLLTTASSSQRRRPEPP